MSRRIDELTSFRIELDDVTVARLMEFADMCHAPPRCVLAAIVTDFLFDNAREHVTAFDLVQVH